MEVSRCVMINTKPFRSPPLGGSQVSAYPAFTPIGSPIGVVCVEIIKKVASHAMSLTGVDAASAVSTKLIHPSRNSFKMSWAHAGRRPAKMIRLQSIWNRAVGQFVRKPVSRHVLGAGPEHAMTALGLGGRPYPTRVSLFHLCPEAVPWSAWVPSWHGERIWHASH